ncbi:hypothetical protein U1Q18_032595, partial [Sarracenia purpurea var. burkii]
PQGEPSQQPQTSVTIPPGQGGQGPAALVPLATPSAAQTAAAKAPAQVQEPAAPVPTTSAPAAEA